MSKLALAMWVALAFAGCRSTEGPPAIDPHTACVKCGMQASDLSLACEARSGDAWHVYDSIECALRDDRVTDPTTLYLADYDSKGLHRADSLWVVHGHFPTPMGGGYAAFATRDAADDLAGTTQGRVDRVTAFVAAERSAAQ